LIRGPGIAAGTHVAQLTETSTSRRRSKPWLAFPHRHSSTDGHCSGWPVTTVERDVTGAPRTSSSIATKKGRPLPVAPQDDGRSRWSPLTPTKAEDVILVGGRAAHGHLSELGDEPVLERHEPIPNYDVRTERYLYVAYTNGERELYDTKADPGDPQPRRNDAVHPT
jgi:hypothetical protein